MAGGFVLLLSEFLDQLLVIRRERGAGELSFLPYVVAVWICLVGLYGIVTSRNLMHAIVCLSVVQSSTYVLLLAVGYRRDFGRARSSSTSRATRPPSTRSCRRWR